MSELQSRATRLGLESQLGLDGSDGALSAAIPALGLSLAMPALESYLVRTMEAALHATRDRALLERLQHFLQAEERHADRHSDFNLRVRAHFPAEVAEELQGLGNAMKGEYERFSRENSLGWNAGYAAGFKAMAFSVALADARQRPPAMGWSDERWPWHMADEIAHRSVAFELHRSVVGSSLHRIARGTWSQYHYLSYVLRFANAIATALGCRPRIENAALYHAALGHWARTLLPWYDPAKVRLPPPLPERAAAGADEGSGVRDT